MKLIFTLAGAAALGIAGPAIAQPGHGHGGGPGQHMSMHGESDHGRAYSHGHRYTHRSYGSTYGYGRGGCPPGLRNKGCMPPGQMKRLSRGDRYRSGFGTYYSYNRIPYRIRQQYDLNNDYRYYYNNGYLYGVNPRTMLVQQVVSALLR